MNPIQKDKIKNHRLKVSDLHELEIYEYGDRSLTPIIFLHGGPGSGIIEKHFELFDPNKYWTILFDQRGCGKSTPHRSLIQNTTWDLVSDIEKIRKHFEIQKWNVVGGSWGSALSIAYASSHPDVVSSVTVWAMTEVTPDEQKKMVGVIPIFFPERWDAYTKNGGAQHTDDVINFEFDEMSSSDPLRVKASGERCFGLFSVGLSLDEKYALTGLTTSDTITYFFFHYCKNNAFFDDTNRPSKRGSVLANKPVRILHGRQDMRCFAESAYRVHKGIPNSTYEIVGGAGHGAMDNTMLAAICKAIDGISR